MIANVTSRTGSCLDNPPLCLSEHFSGETLRSALLPSTCTLFVILIYFALLRPRSLKQNHKHTRAALHALLAVLVPTCSLWPGRYLKFTSIVHSRIDIPLEVIVEDTINGVIEFRNPTDDLADLIGSGLTVKGHIVCINIGWKMWIKYFRWMLSKEAPIIQFKGLSGRPCSSADSPASPLALASSTSRPLLCLDCLPLDEIPKLIAGSAVTLEFTTFSPFLRVFSTARVISAIPFIIFEGPRRRPRTVVSVLEQLRASHHPTVVIDSISNVSANYQHALRHLYKSFSREQKICETLVKFGGMNRWRQEMFLVALEAALVRRGWIERWAIRVTVK